MNAVILAERHALYVAIDRAGFHIAARPQIDPPVIYGPRTGYAMTNEAIFIKNWRDTRYYLVFDLHQTPQQMQWRRAVVDDYGTLVDVGVQT